MDHAHAAALETDTDPALGGRWTSLLMRKPDGSVRQWLWTNPERRLVAQRALVTPGDAFVDAGGGEECFPSIRDPFDHGLVWSRPWREEGDGWQAVAAEGYQLRRRIAESHGVVHADYEATVLRPLPALHATHLLLDLSAAARLHPARLTQVSFLDERPDDEIRELGGVAEFVNQLGQGRTGAVCYSLSCRQLTVVDGDDALRMTLSSPDGLPLAFVIWRNLGGWPGPDPYRSLGIEPGWGKGASLPDGGVPLTPEHPVRWRLTVEGQHRGP